MVPPLQQLLQIDMEDRLRDLQDISHDEISGQGAYAAERHLQQADHTALITGVKAEHVEEQGDAIQRGDADEHEEELPQRIFPFHLITL